MITNTTTPRTDAAEKWTFGDNRLGMSFECVKVEFAQDLERDLNKADTLWQYQKEETDKRITQIRRLQQEATAAEEMFRTYGWKEDESLQMFLHRTRPIDSELKHSPEYMASLLAKAEDEITRLRDYIDHAQRTLNAALSVSENKAIP